MTARERILAKLRAAAPPQPVSRPAFDGGGDAPPLGERVDQFTRQLVAAHAEVIIADAITWQHRLAERLAEGEVRRLLADWQGEAGPTLARALPAAIDKPAFDRPIEEWKEELFETVDAGFSVADAGVAATGTLIFASGTRAPRTVSLVPPLHCALVYADRIYADLPAALAAGRWSDAMPTNLIMVSGPSKTADIQQTLAYGAHGPKQLVVIVVLPDGAPR
jgi:L-lactate dehydrogenase complex protein LldG